MNVFSVSVRPEGLRRIARALRLGMLGALAALMLAGCGTDAGSHHGGSFAGLGGVTGHAVWRAAARPASAALQPLNATPVPGNITTVRLRVSGADFAEISADFAVELHAGVVQGVPQGSNRTLIIEALDASLAVVYRGESAGLTVEAGKTTDAGNVWMDLVNPTSSDLAITAPSAASPFYSNHAATLGGTCTGNPPHTVQLLIGTTASGSAPCTGGAFAIALPTVEGIYNYTVAQVDDFTQQTDATVEWTWVYDITPPALTLSSTSALTTTDLVTLTGTCEDGLTISVTGPGVSAAPACLGGAFSRQVDQTVDGTYLYDVTQTDLASNATSLTFTWRRDTTPPALSVSPSSALTGTNTVNVGGTCETGSTLAVSLSSVVVATPACSGGSFSAALSQTVDGTYAYSVTAMDAAGNTATGSFTWTRDTTVPATLSIAAPTSGTFSRFPLTSITVSGCTVSTPHTVNISEDGVPVLSQACANGTSQAFTFTGTSAEGAHSYAVTQTRDATGITSAAATLTWNIDVTAPAAPAIAAPVAVAPGATGSYLSGTTAITVSGSCEALATVSLAGPVGSPATQGCSSGSYSFNYSSPAGTLLVSQTDLAGNVSGNTTLNWTSDTSVPFTPSIQSPASGTQANVALGTITATCDTSVPHTVAVTEDGTALGSPVACSSSPLTVTLTGATGSAGTHTYAVTQTKVSTGITSAAASVSYIIDLSAPAAPSITSPVAVASGGSGSLVTGTTAITLQGGCETGATVQVAGPGGSSATGACTASAYSIVYAGNSGALALTQADPAGNTSAATALNWTVDTTPPATPSITSPASPTYSQTRLTGITVSGCTTSTPHTVNVREDGVLILSQACASSPETFTFSGTATEGTHSYAVSQTRDATGITSADALLAYVIDVTAPAAPAISAPVVVAGGATGSYTSGTHSIDVVGTCEAAATVELSDGASTQQTTCGTGAYSFTYTTALDGTFTLTLTQQDQAGNVSAASTTLTWTGDTTPPFTPVISSPADNFAANVPLASITVTCQTATLHRVTVKENGSALGSPVDCAGSPLTIPLTGTASTDGTYVYSVTQTRVATGIGSAAASVHYIVDTQATPWALTSPASVTNADSSLTITGICENGATVNLTGSATNSTGCPAGTFTFTVTDTTASSNVDTYSLQQTDAVGNASGTLTVTWTRTIPALAAPVITLPAETVPGSATFYSNAGMVSLAGTCTGNYTVNLTGTQTAQTTCSNSQYSFSIATPGTDGTYSYFVTQTDYASQVSSAAQRIWVYDTANPASLTLQNPTATPVVTANTNSFILSGPCEVNATVLLTGADTQSQVCATGAFSFTVVRAVDGTYDFTLVQQDLAGNQSTAITQEWIRDSTFVPTPAFDGTVAIPAQTSNLADIVVTGTCTPEGTGEQVMIYLEDGVTPLPSQPDDPASPTVGYPYRTPCVPDGLGGGTFSLDLNNSNAGAAAAYWDSASQTLVDAPLPDGTYPFSLVEYRSLDSGVTWDASAGVFYQVIVNTAPPAAPSMTAPVAIAAGGSGTYTAPGPITISGGCEAGDTVTLVRASGNLTTTCAAGGTYSFSGVDELTNDVTYNYALNQTSLAGLTSADTQFAWTRIAGFATPVVTTPATTPFHSNQDSLPVSGTCTNGLDVVIEQPAGTAEQQAACSAGTFLFVVNRPTGGTQVDRTFDFAVYQTNGVQSSASAAFQWHQDTTPPDISVTYALPIDPATPSSAGAPLTSPAAQSVFEFSSSDPTATLQCNLNGASWGACTSPTVYTSAQIPATPAVNSIAIRAVDLAGNVTAVPYERYWVRQSFGTIALYHLDSAAPTADASPYDAITPSALTDSGTVSVTGQFAQGRTFASASSNSMDVGDRVHHGVRTAMTIEMWVRFTSAPANIGDEYILAAKWDSGAQYAWEFGVRRTTATRSAIFFRTYTQTATGLQAVQAVSSNFSPSTTAFQHYAVTWNRGVVSLFRNGRRRAQVTVGISGTSLSPDGIGNLYLGTTENGAGTLTKFFNGRMDEVRVSQALCYRTSTYTVPTAAFTTADCATP